MGNKYNKNAVTGGVQDYGVAGPNTWERAGDFGGLTIPAVTVRVVAGGTIAAGQMCRPSYVGAAQVVDGQSGLLDVWVAETTAEQYGPKGIALEPAGSLDVLTIRLSGAVQAISSGSVVGGSLLSAGALGKLGPAAAGEAVVGYASGDGSPVADGDPFVAVLFGTPIGVG